MTRPGTAPKTVRFGVFEVDFSNTELRKHGVRLRLQQQPFQILAALLDRPGEVVTREDLVARLWPDGTVVDFDRGLNAAVTRLRQALSDSAEAPKYVETVAGRGYRFVAPVAAVDKAADDSAPMPTPVAPPLPASSRRGWPWLAAVLFLIAGAGATIWFILRQGNAPPEKPALVRLTSDTGLTITPALSEDGKLVAYASDRGGDGHLDIWVQQVGGSEAIRLTRGAADSHDPSFSSDGRRIAFRSERDGGGIYVVSALGGDAKRIAPLGSGPRFSPDGNWIAYQIGGAGGGFLGPGTAKIYVVPSAGGTPRELRSEFAAAAHPIWTPDGSHLLFLGNRDPKVKVEPVGSLRPTDTSVDWWVTPLDNGPAVPTGVSAALRNLGFVLLSQTPAAWTAGGDGVLMSATLGDTTNLWLVPISPKTWKLSGTPRRLTFGTTPEVQPAIATGGQVAFASLNENVNIWSLPIEANRARVAGGLRRLTEDTAVQSYPAVSGDGKKLAFSSRRSGNREIWLKDLVNGKEAAVVAMTANDNTPLFSPDGHKLRYQGVEKGTRVSFVMSLAGGAPERICEDCGSGGWSSDGKGILYRGPSPGRVSVLNLGSRQSATLLDHATYALDEVQFSPDDRWVSFQAYMPGRSLIFVAPVRNAGPIAEPEWINIAASGWDNKPRWSPDGKILYFVSERDGFRCIWAQRLDPATKRPLEPAVPIFHAHEARRSLMNVGWGPLQISVANDKIVFNLSERTGNIWLMKPESLK